MGEEAAAGRPLPDSGKLTDARARPDPLNVNSKTGFLPVLRLRSPVSRGAGMHLLQAICPERDQPVVTVEAEVREVLQQPVGKLLIPCGTGAPRLGQHGVVGPVVADPLLAEHVLVGGAGRVPPPTRLPGELALGVGQLQEHCP